MSGGRYRETVNYANMKWPMVKLGDSELFRVESGGTPKSAVKEYWNGVIHWATLVDLPSTNFITEIRSTQRTITELGLNKSSARLIPENSVIVSSRATIGRIAINRIPLATNQGFKNIVIKDPNRIIPEYLAHMLTKLVPTMEARASGGTFKEISKSKFCELQIPLPPLKVQQEIVSEIEGYQRVIDGARAVVENYRPQIVVDPESPMMTISELTKPEYGFTEKAEDQGDARFIRITDISGDGTLRSEEPKFITLTSEAQKSILEKGDILVARTGATYGKTMIFEEDYSAVFASYLIRLRFPLERVHPSYYWAFTQSDAYWDQARTLVTGGGQPQFNGNAIKQIRFPLPSLETQQAIVAEIEAEQALVNANRELIERFEKKIREAVERVWDI